MNKQELLNELNDIMNTYSGEDSYENGVIIGLGTAIAKIGKLDEPEKVKPLVVPKDLGKWLSEQSLGDEEILFNTIKRLDNIWVNSGFEYFITSNKKALIEVILGLREYEVEKEKLYRVELPSGHVMYMSGTEDKASYSYMPTKYAKTTPDFLFTEVEIKAIDKRYWTFAVEVADISGE